MAVKAAVKVTMRKSRRKVAVSELTDGAVMAVLESEAKSIDPEVRRQLVAAEAYFFAERRGFAAADMVVHSGFKQKVAYYTRDSRVTKSRPNGPAW
jgi:hypothetical protein